MDFYTTKIIKLLHFSNFHLKFTKNKHLIVNIFLILKSMLQFFYTQFIQCVILKKNLDGSVSS